MPVGSSDSTYLSPVLDVCLVAVDDGPVRQLRPKQVARDSPKRLAGLWGINASYPHGEVPASSDAAERIAVMNRPGLFTSHPAYGGFLRHRQLKPAKRKQER